MATKSSDVMMSIRLPKELKDSFAKVCEKIKRHLRLLKPLWKNM